MHLERLPNIWPKSNSSVLVWLLHKTIGCIGPTYLKSSCDQLVPIRIPWTLYSRHFQKIRIILLYSCLKSPFTVYVTVFGKILQILWNYFSSIFDANKRHMSLHQDIHRLSCLYCYTFCQYAPAFTLLVKRTFAIRFRYLLMNAVRIPLTHRLVLYTLEAGDCLFCVQLLCQILIPPLNHSFSLHRIQLQKQSV